MNNRYIHGEETLVTTSDPIGQILTAVDLDWVILKAPLEFTPMRAETRRPLEVEGHSVLYRSDNQEQLAIVPSHHRPWQPREVIDFYLSVSAFYGLALESIGYVQGGRKLWGVLNTGNQSTFRRSRSASTHLLLSTSCDSPLAAQATSLCILEPGGCALSAAPGKPTIARIARSMEFLTSAELADIGELMRECISFPSLLEDISRYVPSELQVKRVVAATFGSRDGDPNAPSAKALRAVVTALDRSRTAAKHTDTTALDLLYALASVSDARDQQRFPDDVRHATWFAAGANRKQFGLRALSRLLQPCT